MPVSMFTTKTESVKRLGHECAEPERDDDRDDRHHERDEPGEDGAEDKDEHDERGGQPDLELARLEVVLREVVEVVLEGALARHRDAEAVAPVVSLDHAQEPVDVCATLHRDQGGVLVLGDLRGIVRLVVGRGVEHDPGRFALRHEPPDERLEGGVLDRARR
jgi:hypothetical protein